MDALRQPGPRSETVIVFRGAMGSSSRKKAKQTVDLERPPATSSAAEKTETEQKLALPSTPGKFERWSPICLAALGLLISGAAYWHTVDHERSQAAAASSDEHVKILINEKLDPLIAQLNQVTGQINQMNWQRNLSELKEGPREAPGTANSRSEVMSNLRANLVEAQKLQQKLPLAEAVQRIQEVPNSTQDYWATIASIINYQSYLNQLEGHAPDPNKVARPCPFATASAHISNNELGGTQHFTDCYIDLDTNGNVIDDAIIKDSVVRYHGGNINFKHAVFNNCRFIVELRAPQLRTPARDLLVALLNSDQVNFTLPIAS
jgi:hypothetical protein